VRLDVVDDVPHRLAEAFGSLRRGIAQGPVTVVHGLTLPARRTGGGGNPRVRWLSVADWKRGLRRVLYPAYEARVVRRLPADRLPKHVGVMLDGNRRWARAVGQDAAAGHRAGAANISPLLQWCEELGVEVVTLWLLSTDNLNRPPDEISELLGIIEEAVADLAAEQRWRLHPVGALDLLPAGTARRLKEAADQTRDVDGLIVNIAVGYGGRREIADAVRALLSDHASRGTSIEELAGTIDVDQIAEHLYTKGQPDPDLVIRTSGEQRLGGFLLWQSAHSEFYFCEAYWPDFRRVDFLRAVRAYAERERRFGA
jgi:short-chain Z-isoprenyl diphosphate synthase